MKRMLASFAAPCLVLLAAAQFSHAQATADPWQALPQYRFGQSREPLATIEEQIRKSTPAERTAIEKRLLEILQAANTTPDSRRFICRTLAVVGSERSVKPLAALLTDPDLAHPARIALEALPQEAAGRALTDALSRTSGNLRLGVIASLGARREAPAVPELTRLLKHEETAVVAATLAALGQIGTESAAKALTSARVSPGLERDLARAQVSAASRLAAAGKRSQAAAIFQELRRAPDAIPAIRAAAFQGLAATLPAKEAVALIVEALEGEDPLLRSAAVTAFAGAGESRGAVAAQLPRMQARGQLLLLGMLADAPDLAARKPVLQVAESAAEPAVLAAAVECLAVHGKAEDVPLLAKWAATGQGPVKPAAKRALQRISGAGVDAALIGLVESPDRAVRTAVLEALPARRMGSALPTLVRLTRGNDPARAVEAAGAVGAMGGPAELKDLAEVLSTTPNEELRQATQEAFKSICTRTEDKAACDAVLQAQLSQASSPSARKALLPLTVYTGSDAGFQQVVKALNDADTEVRTVAFRTLVSWPDARAGAPLLRYAAANPDTTQAILALRDGCLRLAEMEEIPPADRAAILRGVADVARRPEEKRRAISLMGQVPAPELLETLPKLAADQAFRAEATTAGIQLARSLAAVYPRQSLAALEQLKPLANTPELSRAVDNGFRAVRNAGQSPEGYILGWLVSGPYTEANKEAGDLFDVAFAPERAPREAQWRPLVAPSNGIVDLRKSMPGDNRVAYLRATVSSDREQKAVLELGSDDGVKAWLNGALVHGNNTVRPCSPGQDKVNVTLKPGENTLLLKIIQGGGDWAAVARLRGPDGKPLADLMVEPATR